MLAVSDAPRRDVVVLWQLALGDVTATIASASANREIRPYCTGEPYTAGVVD